MNTSIMSSKQFEGRRVLVTGGGSGIGADMALAFANAGAQVMISGRRANVLQGVAALHQSIRYEVADVSNEQDVERLYEKAGPCDIVIANAGIAASAPIAKISLDDWNQMMAVNLTGVFLTLREGVKQMGGWGRLISIASIAGLRGYGYVAHYCASKHGVVGLTRALAMELGKRDITANAICPGYIDTPMTERSARNIAEKTGKDESEARSLLASGSPKKLLIQPEEITQTAFWLCGEGSKNINGQAIAINGGEF